MPQPFRAKLNENLIWRASRILNRRDRHKAIFIVIVQALLGILDVIAVFTVGLIGSLTISGVASKAPGDKVNRVLAILELSDNSLQTQVTVLGLAAAGILVFKSLASLYMSKRMLFFLSRRSAFISQKLIARLFGDDFLRIRSQTLQEIIYALTGGVQTVTLNVLGASAILIADILLLIFFSVSLFVVDTLVALSSFLFFSILGFVLYRYMHHRAKILGEIATNLSIKSGDKIAEVVACYRELLVKHRRAFYAEEIGAMRLSISEAGARLGVMNLLSKYIMEIGFVIGGIAIGASQFILQPAGRAVGVISVFLVASTRIVPAVLRVQTGLVAIKVSVGTAKATLDLIEEYSTSIQVEESQIIPNFPSLAHEGFVGNVVLNEVRFRYPGRDNNAISNLSIEIDEGEFFGVVGPSGSGKTTLVDLMMGVLNPDQGLVSISNESPRNAVRLWPGAIAYVPQEVCIIKGTIKDNICLGFDSRNIGNQAIEEILKNAQLGEFLSLSEGIHSLLGDKGNSLSGGQRQRLGIARALLTKPKLLILDEATSGLDALTEERLSDYLFSLKGQLTLIVIAHRLSTIKKADRILYLGDGNVKGIGDFDQLRISVCDFDKQASLMGF